MDGAMDDDAIVFEDSYDSISKKKLLLDGISSNSLMDWKRENAGEEEEEEEEEKES